jgi:predicted 2-oxoglutarate/Fe(II)-dependent dioxygenase YbiX
MDFNSNFPNRRWNLGIQLNDNYSGGEYICYDENNKEILLSKEVGNAIAYDATTLHEIKEIVDGERWSIVLTILKKDILEKMHLI